MRCLLGLFACLAVVTVGRSRNVLQFASFLGSKNSVGLGARSSFWVYIVNNRLSPI